ncbi:tandem-95 repeat protein [Myxococcus sp. CA033]|uniref:tandem-95 repeat protein n=1 Tax=Myxococcus sp. CA033 TaxID=2741516 RepID=UPI00157AEBE1|nr:Ig-like domain-containing protein [Myxococcus sp. CA033]NTX38845.1 tandem-95 repeat protein [Myxococcus sp. CA033]
MSSLRMSPRGFACLAVFLCIAAVTPAWADSRPAFLAPGLSFETLVGAVTMGPASDHQFDGAVAWNGTHHLVVWTDYRHGGSSGRIYAARVSPTGEVLDPAGVLISPIADKSTTPHVLFDGTNFFVVWHATRPGEAGDLILGAHVTPEGQLVEPTPRRLASAAPGSVYGKPTVAFSGSQYLVTWSEYAPDLGPTLRGTRLSSSGDVLDIMGLELGEGREPTVSWGGTDFLVVSTRGNLVQGTRVSVEGTSLGSFVISPPNAIFPVLPVVAFDGQNHLVVWEDQLTPLDFNRDILGARVSPEGIVLGTFIIHTNFAHQSMASVAFNGTHFLVAWHDMRYVDGVRYGGIHGARITTSGGVLDPNGRVLVANRRNFTASPCGMASTGTEFFVTWYGGKDEDKEDIRATRVSNTGTVLAESLLVSTSANRQEEPAVASDGNRTLLVWMEQRPFPQGTDLYGTLLSVEGVELTPGGFVISQTAGDQGDPAVAFDGTNYLVVWRDTRTGIETPRLHGRRISASGVPVRREFPIHAHRSFLDAPRLACGGGDCFAVWDEPPVSSGFGDIARGARVSPTDVVLDPLGIDLGGGAPESYPAVSFDGTNFLAVWEVHPSGSGVLRRLEAVRVSRAGTVLAPGRILVRQSELTPEKPSIAFDGTNHVIAWTEGGTVRALRVDTEGMVVDPEPWLLSSPGQEPPFWGQAQVAATGTSTLVYWLSSAPGDSTANLLLGARIDSASGTVDTPVELGTLALEYQLPSATSVGANRFLLAYQRFVGPPYAALRVHARMVDYDAAPLAVAPARGPSGGSNAKMCIPHPSAPEVAIEHPAQDVADDDLVNIVTDTPPADIQGEEGYVYVTSGLEDEHGQPGMWFPQSEQIDPMAFDRSEVLTEDTSVELILESLAADNDTLKYSLVELPRHGRLSGTTPNLVYTPHPDFHGEDYLTFRVSDGVTESTSAQVLLSVKPVNDAPVAMSREVTVSAEGPVELELEGRDVDGDIITFELSEGPSQGELTGTLPHVVYRPRAGASREDSFTFAVSDGEYTTFATVTLHITPVNHAPIASNARLTMKAGERRAVVLDARDADQDALTYSVSARPASGELSGKAPSMTYEAAPDFEGEVSLVFTVTDGAGLASTGTVRIQVEKSATYSIDSEPRLGALGCGAAPGSVTPLLLALVALCLLARRQPRVRCSKFIVNRPQQSMRA